MLEFATARRTPLIARNYNTVGATGRSRKAFRPARHARYYPAPLAEQRFGEYRRVSRRARQRRPTGSAECRRILGRARQQMWRVGMRRLLCLTRQG
jgi:hypothetical protein